MASESRLTLLCAVLLAALGLAVPALAEAGPAAGAAGVPSAAGQSQGAGESGAAPRAPSQQQHPAPSGCPFRDGKLELIV